MTLLEYFQHQYATLSIQSASERRFVVFHPTDHTGWGNKLRGFVLAVLLSVATKRVLVVREFLLEEHFLPPEGCDWFFSTWRRELLEWKDQTTTMELHLSPSNWNESEWQSYRKDSMDSLFPKRVIELNEGVAFSDQLMVNENYVDLWKSLGLDPSSKLAWMGEVCRSFLNRPTTKLTRKLGKLRKRVGLGASEDFGVLQFRTFFDIGSPRKPLVERFLEETTKLLTQEGLIGLPIYIATDDARVTRELTAALSPVARVIPSPTVVVHTGYIHAGLLRLLERVLQRLLGRRFWLPDFWVVLPNEYRPRPHTAVIAEWFLYGEARFAISSFTSFAVFGLARSGNSARLYKFDSETLKVAELTNDQYDF